MSVTKDQLLARRLREEDVEVEGIGTVRIRSLSRREVLEARELDGLEFERYVVAAAMVNPAMTPEDVDAWEQASMADELEKLVRDITRVSALTKGAPKAAYKSPVE